MDLGLESGVSLVIVDAQHPLMVGLLESFWIQVALLVLDIGPLAHFNSDFFGTERSQPHLNTNESFDTFSDVRSQTDL
jgi:hypothetical protein